MSGGPVEDSPVIVTCNLTSWAGNTSLRSSAPDRETWNPTGSTANGNLS